MARLGIGELVVARGAGRVALLGRLAHGEGVQGVLLLVLRRVGGGGREAGEGVTHRCAGGIEGGIGVSGARLRGE